MLRDIENLLRIKSELNEWWERYCSAKSSNSVAATTLNLDSHSFQVSFRVTGENKHETMLGQFLEEVFTQL
jgi:hypothetical protein